MRGHSPLIAMRRNGQKPAHVTLTDEPGFLDWHVFAESQPFPDLLIEPEDTPELLDLRCLVGLRVVVRIEDPARMKRVVLACESAGAEKTYGFAIKPLPHHGGEIVAAICTHGDDQSWRA